MTGLGQKKKKKRPWEKTRGKNGFARKGRLSRNRDTHWVGSLLGMSFLSKTGLSGRIYGRGIGNRTTKTYMEFKKEGSHQYLKGSWKILSKGGGVCGGLKKIRRGAEKKAGEASNEVGCEISEGPVFGT